MTTKDTNPKESIGLTKLPLHLWPSLASAYGCVGLLNGAEKYGRGNYKATPVIASIYIAALKRHLSEWEEGVEYDGDGVPHIAAILANCAIILEARSVGTLIDDRNIPGGYVTEVNKLTAIAQSLIELHKGKNPRHYTILDNK